MNELTITFSEPVAWTSLAGNQFTVNDAAAGVSKNSAAGADAGTTFTLTCTGSAATGPTGTTSFANSPAGQITSLATGLPLLPFSGLPTVIFV